jgi:hypothetical protein
MRRILFYLSVLIFLPETVTGNIQGSGDTAAAKLYASRKVSGTPQTRVLIRSSNDCLILSISNEVPVLADLIIYSAFGQKVYAGKILLSDIREKVCLTGIREGVYFYSISKRGNPIHMGKFFHL